jgi:hypothetical protein
MVYTDMSGFAVLGSCSQGWHMKEAAAAASSTSPFSPQHEHITPKAISFTSGTAY